MSDPKPNPLAILRRLFLGAPIPTSQASHERLGPLIGLPVFSSDALSSVAYASEAILQILVLMSLAMLPALNWISLGIVILIVLVAFSYYQTIHAYPTGGGSYIVASENLGETPGLIAGAALLVDYVLTVSVSVSAGIAAITSAYQGLHPYVVPLALGCVAIVAWMNLRGVKESGVAFAIPTYGFVICLLALIIFGLFKTFGTPQVAQSVIASDGEHSLIGKEAAFPIIFILARAFAAGCTALTGIEAVSNGVQAFKAPEAKNASTTLVMMVVLLSTMFLGVSFLALRLPELSVHTGSNPAYETVVSQIAGWAFGKGSIAYLGIQIFTMLILVLAANTAFADFPRLASLLARDGFLPRPLARQGDRLVFHNGILFLALASGAIIWYFKGHLDGLLSLYAVGVFTAFTLSQFGMVVHWKKAKPSDWKGILINGLGGVATLCVLLIILVTKWSEGAWMVAILLGIQFVLFRAIKGRYRSITNQLVLGDHPPVPPSKHLSILLVNRVHRGVISALHYAKAASPNLKAIHIAINRKALPEVQSMWNQYAGGIPLEVINSPYRSLITPVLIYIDKLREEDPDQVITVIVPEAYSTGFLHKLLQENVATQLKEALGQRRNVVVTNVRYFLD